MTDIRQATNAYANILNQIHKPSDTAGSDGNGAMFGDMLKQSLESAAQSQHTSERVSGAALAGKADMTEVLQAVTDAEMALNTVLALRDKVVQAYESIMRTAI